MLVFGGGGNNDVKKEEEEDAESCTLRVLLLLPNANQDSSS